MLNEELIYEAQRMLHERCVYFQQKEKKMEYTTEQGLYRMYSGMASAYKGACDILLAAVQGNEEILKEFDYYAAE